MPVRLLALGAGSRVLLLRTTWRPLSYVFIPLLPSANLTWLDFRRQHRTRPPIVLIEEDCQ